MSKSYEVRVVEATYRGFKIIQIQPYKQHKPFIVKDCRKSSGGKTLLAPWPPTNGHYHPRRFSLMEAKEEIDRILGKETEV